MASQAELKRRLNVLMKKPENMICSDCPERQPRWASLIVPPPGSPAGSLPIGAFCCLECSGSHRRLGVHISFVRSVNLDSWKEKEVLAMENGGNAKVNAIYEVRLQLSGSVKPSNQASGPTRERFIRDKYERRKFYDAGVMEQYQCGKIVETEESSHDIPSGNGGRRPLRVVARDPSEAARKRAEVRRKSRLPRNGQATKTNSPKKQSAPSPAPVQSNVVDLLDFGCDPVPAPATASAAVHDPFSPTSDPFAAPALVPSIAPVASTNSGVNFANFGGDPFSSTLQTTQTGSSVEVNVVKETSNSKEEYSSSMATTTTTSTAKPAMNSDDIMKLFHQPGAGNGMQNMGGGGMPPQLQANAFNGLGGLGMMTNGGQHNSMTLSNGNSDMMMGNSMGMPLAGIQNNSSTGGASSTQSVQQQQYMLQQQMLLMQQQQQMQMMMKQVNFNSTTSSTSTTVDHNQMMGYQQQQNSQTSSSNYTSGGVGSQGTEGIGFGGMAPMGGTTQFNQNTGGGGGISMSQLNMMNRVNNVNLSGGAVGMAEGLPPAINGNTKPKDDRFSDLSQFGT